MRTITLCLSIAAALPWAGSAGAAVVDPGMEAIAKELLRRTTSDAQRASLLHEAAADCKDEKTLRVYLNEQALEYALASVHVESSRRVAYNAIGALRVDAPERRDHWYAKRIELCRRHYRSPLAPDKKRAAGRYFADYLISYAQRYESERRWDVALPMYKEAAGVFEALGSPGKNELAMTTANAAHKAETYKKITELDKQYEKNPKDAEVRKTLACLWIIDMNYPSRATRYISSKENKTWHDCAHRVSYSMRGVTDPTLAKKVGDWYHQEIVPLASPAMKRSMLLRARSYYEHAHALKYKAGRKSLSKLDRKAIQDAMEKISAELKGDKKQEWTVIFRSDDAAVWNTDRSTGTLSYAVPLREIGGPVRYLRMTRQDTGHFVIIPMKAMWLDRTVTVTSTRGHGWQGEKTRNTGGGYSFGVYSRRSRPGSSQRVNITYEHWGWGFGYDRRAKKSVWTWAGRALDKTTFKIEVTNGDLTAAEAKYLLP